AQYYLAQFSPWMDGEFDNGEKMLVELAKEFPANKLFAFTRAVWEIRRNDVSSAREHLRTIVDSPDDPTDGIRMYARYKLAECEFRLNRYDEARKFYQSFLREYHDETYRATANYRIGVCFELSGRRDSALGYYKIVATMERKFGDDIYSARKAGLRLKSPMAAEDSLLIAAQNALNSGAYDSASAYASQLQRMAGHSTDMNLEAQFLIAESFFEKKSYQQALEGYRSIAVKKAERELWLVPWSHYQSGLCLLKLNDPGNAKKEFERTLDSEEYDFSNWIEFRAKREIEKIDSRPVQ
ncbi:MAG TPA: tetratricopeptide repeat protein, partial [Bacteroidota bacterium]|nr:tetratricopeptide repeat protein [Bacteroidota bacterium]